jgi:hypothetical protein
MWSLKRNVYLGPSRLKRKGHVAEGKETCSETSRPDKWLGLLLTHALSVILRGLFCNEANVKS